MNAAVEKLNTKLETATDRDRVNLLLDRAFELRHQDPRQTYEDATAALDLARQFDLKRGIIEALNMISVSHDVRGDYDQAIENSLEALRLAQEYGIDDLQPVIYNNLGISYKNQGDFDYALECHFKVLEIKQKNQDKYGMGAAQYNIGNTYFQLKEFEHSLQYLFLAVDHFKEANFSLGVSLCLSKIGEIYLEEQDYEKALDFLEQARPFYEEMQDKKGLANTWRVIGSVRIRLQDHDGAQEALDKGLKLAIELEAKQIQFEIYQLLSELYEAQGKSDEALAFYKTYCRVKDLVYNAEKSKLIANIHARYQAEQKEKEARIYRLENVELKSEIQYRQQVEAELRKSNYNLEQLIQEKNEFLGIVSHDLKNPLTHILGVVELMAMYQDNIPENEREQFLDMIRSNSERMLDLIHKLLDINRLESGRMDFNLVPIDIAALVAEVAADYQGRASAKQQTLTFASPENNGIQVLADMDAARQVLDNLVSNAVKYTPLKGTIKVMVAQQEKVARIRVEDNGQGLSPHDMNKLFQKFARLTARPTGDEHASGLGLSIVKKLVESMHGRVWAESTGRGRGSTFLVELPLVTEPD